MITESGPEALLRAAAQMLGKGEPAEALRLLDEGLAQRPGFPPFASLRGIALLHQGKGEAALRQLEAVVAQVPRWPDGRANLGYVLEALDRRSEAERVLRSLLAEHPQHETAALTLTRLLARLGRYEEAIAAAEATLQHRPQNRALRHNLAQALRDKGERAASLQVLMGLFQQDGRDTDAANRAASLLLEEGRAAEALALLDTALQQGPKHAAAHNNRGTALRNLQRSEEALAAYRQSLALDPKRAQAWRNLGLLAADLEHLSEATEALRRVIQLDPGDSVAQHMLDAVEGRTTAAPPEGFLAASFDAFAESFDDQLVERLGYSVPEALPALASRARSESSFVEALDIGCGTGLVALAFGDRVQRWTGIDLSPKMLQQAERRGLYHRLQLGEAAALIGADPTLYDLVTAADLLIYLGDIQPLFRAVSAHLKPGGLFLLSTERCQPEEGACRLRPTGRYAQSDDHVLYTAEAVDLACIVQETTILRKQHGEDVEGCLFAFQAPLLG